MSEPDPSLGSSHSAGISVIIACYNEEATIGQQLNALAAQTCPVSWEVIVADNGSTDGSLDVVRRYVGHLPCLRVIDASQKRGASYARNRGVAAAQGQWILFCDGDDVVGPGWLCSMYQALLHHDFVAGAFEITKLNDPRLVKTRRPVQADGLQQQPNGLPYAGAGNMGIKRAVFEAAGGFDESLRYLEDVDLCWRVQYAGTPLFFVEDAVLHVRYRAQPRRTFQQARAWAKAKYLLCHRHGIDLPESRRLTAHILKGTKDRIRHALSVRDTSSLHKWMWATGWFVGMTQALLQSKLASQESARDRGHTVPAEPPSPTKLPSSLVEASLDE